MNTIETCGAAGAQILVASGQDELTDRLDDYDGLPVISIENGASHSYVLTGTPGQLLDFAARISVAAYTAWALATEGLPEGAAVAHEDGAKPPAPAAGDVQDAKDTLVHLDLDTADAANLIHLLKTAAEHETRPGVRESGERIYHELQNARLAAAERNPLWWDDASYIRYQSEDPGGMEWLDAEDADQPSAEATPPSAEVEAEPIPF